MSEIETKATAGTKQGASRADMERERLEGLAKAKGLTEVTFSTEENARGATIYRVSGRYRNERRIRRASSALGPDAALAALGRGIGMVAPPSGRR